MNSSTDSPAAETRRAVGRAVLIALAILALLFSVWLVVRLQAFLVLVVIAVVLACGIDPVVEKIESWRFGKRGIQIPRSLAILLVLLLALLFFAGLITFIGSVLWTEGQRLWEQLPQFASSAQGWFSELHERYPQIPELGELTQRAQEQMGQIGNYAMRTTVAVFGVLGGLLSTFTVLVLTFYIEASKKQITSGFLQLIPPDNRDRVGEVFNESAERMGGWLRGQLMLAGGVIVVISATMWLLGMPYPFMLGIIGGIAELIPMMGPAVAAVIAIPIAAVTQPLWVTIVVIVFFIVLAQIEGNYLSPKVMESQVGLPPLVTIVALLVGGALLGIAGALLAVPVAAGLRVLFLKLAMPAIYKAYGETDKARKNIEEPTTE